MSFTFPRWDFDSLLRRIFARLIPLICGICLLTDPTFAHSVVHSSLFQIAAISDKNFSTEALNLPSAFTARNPRNLETRHATVKATHFFETYRLQTQSSAARYLFYSAFGIFVTAASLLGFDVDQLPVPSALVQIPTLDRGDILKIIKTKNYSQSPEYVEALKKTLLFSKEDDLRTSIISSLSKNLKNPNAFDLLVLALNDANSDIRYTAADSLQTYFKNQNLVNHLIEHLRETQSAVLGKEYQDELLGILESAQKLRWDVPFRLRLKDLATLIHNHSVAPSEVTKPLAVVLQSVEDDDKSLENLSDGVDADDRGVQYQKTEGIMALTRGYHLLYYQIGSNEEYAQAILDATKKTEHKITLFVTSSHMDEQGKQAWWGPREPGKPFKTILSDGNNFLNADDPRIFKKYPQLSEQFEPGVVIVLDGCFSGINGKNKTNQANMYRKLIPAAGKIYGATTEVEGFSFQFDNDFRVSGIDWLNRDYRGKNPIGYIASSRPIGYWFSDMFLKELRTSKLSSLRTSTPRSLLASS